LHIFDEYVIALAQKAVIGSFVCYQKVQSTNQQK